MSVHEFRKVHFLVPYPLGSAPSQRFRVEQFFSILKTHGIPYEVHSFLDDEAWQILYKKSPFKKMRGVILGFHRRLQFLWKGIGKDDIVFIHREASPVGPPFTEWWISKVWKNKIIYDFDDAIWIPNISEKNKWVFIGKSFWKVRYLIKWASVCTPGNRFLENFAVTNGAKETKLLPTVVDLDRYTLRKDYYPDKPTIGWTGSHSTIKYLYEIIPALKQLRKEQEFNFIIIADNRPVLDFPFEFIKWNAESEIEDLKRIDIGIMPLANDRWAEGKCGFKLIQFMAIGSPAVASGVGVNVEIIDHGINGLICNNEEEWILSLQLLLQDQILRLNLQKAARLKIEEKYSTKIWEKQFISLFLKS